MRFAMKVVNTWTSTVFFHPVFVTISSLARRTGESLKTQTHRQQIKKKTAEFRNPLEFR
jgi:hypothetical protein